MTDKKKPQNIAASTDIELLNLKLLDTEQKLTQMTELGKRAIADMENMRRRAEEDRSKMALFANIDLIKALLPSIDNLHRSVEHIPLDCPPNLKEWITGITNINNQLTDTLSKAGVTEIEALNLPFDPTCHEAIVQDKGPLNQVTQVLEKGYRLGQFIIRPAKVKVGMGE